MFAKKGLIYSVTLGAASLTILILLLVSLYFYVPEVKATIQLSSAYFQYQLENGAKGSILNLLLSGRLSKLDTVLLSVEKLNYLPLLIGGVDILSYAVEMDFFDILFLYGVPFTLFIFYFWFYIFVLQDAKSKGKAINRFMFVFFVGWFLLSFLAGHFIYSASASIYLVYVSSLATKEN